MTFEDSEIETIERAKDKWKMKRNLKKITWRKFILDAADILESDLEEF